MSKPKINFADLTGGETSFDITGDASPQEISNSNILSPVNNDLSIKKKSKTKEFEYKKIFDNSLSEYKQLKTTAQLYEYNMNKINLLASLNKDSNKTEIINYIINDFFNRNSDEIKEEYKLASIEFNKTL
ncbi:hypothetical protein B0A67_24020 [Flavobacterium aquidurense]|jgi:hypothetical protein|uniref:hypothetical protein n=1 Tax=Flavobacterium aquidurense TaxID=362413 RepID=UPI00091CB1C8|nr:hypothetical protein [Flavobacterium aquidurense]OXA65952.1 hypothetical protein B0A67_24020 [Flavobacterium aquidurense]SHH85139.1 hypothetical protein SAMN05444481_13420 [Flavobacterium frigidimaris]